MPSISEASANAKKLKQQIAEQAGVETNYVNDRNLVEAQKMLHGAEAVSASGQDPTKVDPVQLKTIGSGGESVQSKPEDVSKQQKIAMVITALAPALLGFVAGGKEGGAMGAQASVGALKQMGETQRENDKFSRDIASRKELKTMELQARGEDNKSNRENQRAIAEMNADANRGNRSITNSFAQERIDMARQRVEEANQKKLFEKTFEGKLAKLPKEKADSVMREKEALQAIQGMGGALTGGDNTFSIIGDNDFTRNKRMFEEALGRMQSGGAITSGEVVRFSKMAPTIQDSADQQQKKLAQIEKMFQERLMVSGFKPEEFGIQSNLLAGGIKQNDKTADMANPMVDSANAGPAGRSKPLEEMNEAELQAHVNRLKGK